MLIVYIDSDANMQERLTETFKVTHRVLTFAELFEAYKWIKHNDIPDVIVTEMDVDSSMGLQSLKFLQSKAKLKQTHKIGYTQTPGDYVDLVVSEGAGALFAKEQLLDELTTYINYVSSKKKTLKDLQNSRNKNVEEKSVSKKAIT